VAQALNAENAAGRPKQHHRGLGRAPRSAERVISSSSPRQQGEWETRQRALTVESSEVRRSSFHLRRLTERLGRVDSRTVGMRDPADNRLLARLHRAAVGVDVLLPGQFLDCQPHYLGDLAKDPR
jgi:hypothetical protein